MQLVQFTSDKQYSQGGVQPVHVPSLSKYE